MCARLPTHYRMRDYLLRFAVTLGFVSALSVVPAWAQDDDEFAAYFPPAKPADAAANETNRLMKLIRHGSASDRTGSRQELMRLGADAVPRLLDELETGNQI